MDERNPEDLLRLNVYFEDRSAGVWSAAELLESIDHAPGTEIRLKG